MRGVPRICYQQMALSTSKEIKVVEAYVNNTSEEKKEEG